MAAVNDPVHTLRRMVTNWGFAHYIKLAQAPGAPCWMLIDAYGPMEGLSDSAFITDEQMDEKAARYPIVYTPQDDDLWSEEHGLKANPDCVCGQPRHEGALDECLGYRPNGAQIA